MWLIIVSICIIIPFIYLLFAPFFVEIDSTIGLYRLRFHRLFTVSIIFNEQSILIQIKILAWKKEIDLLAKRKTKQIDVNAKAIKRKGETNISIKKIKGVISSFKVNKFYLTIDTGNMQANGILYPAFLLWSIKSRRDISINFINENKLTLQIENNFARMIWAFLKS